MKKTFYILLFFIIMLMSFSTTVFASEINNNLKIELNDLDYTDSAYTIKIDNKEKRMKAIIQFKDEKYQYELFEGNNDLPLQFGDGEYNIIIYENVKGTSYKKLKSKTINVIDNKDSFINFSQIVNAKNAEKLLEKKTEFIKEKMTDNEKIIATYNFVVSLLSYDYDKINKLESWYIPNADEILSLKKGICYDYSIIMAIILRSEGIPTKVNMGYYKGMSLYHAWNEVYVDNEWKTIDATFELKRIYQDSSKYTVSKFY